LGLFLTKLRSNRFDAQGGEASTKSGFSAAFQTELAGQWRLDNLGTAPLRARRGSEAESARRVSSGFIRLTKAFSCHAFANPRQILIWCRLAAKVAVPVFAGGTAAQLRRKDAIN
jgi:hypothetical protein